jgi:tetratricopeptide (TPR) repeat protein
MTNKWRKWLPFLLLISLSAFSLAFDSADDQTYKDHLQTGVRLLREGDFSQAVTELKVAHEMAPDSLKPLYYLGEAEFKRQEWGDAKDWFEKVLEKDQNDIAAHYYLGICHRELGKYKALIARSGAFGKAQRHFEFVMNKAPDFDRVFCEYAELERLRRHYRAAVDYAERQLAYKPLAGDVLVRVYDMYDGLLYHQNGDDTRKWLAERNTPRSFFFIGESYRREEKFARADSIFMYVLLPRLIEKEHL